MLPGLGRAYNVEKNKAAKIFRVYVLFMLLLFLGGTILLLFNVGGWV